MAQKTQETTQGRVFVSYSRKDLDVAEALRDALIARGFDAFLDIHDIDPGEKWKDRLGDLIASAEKIVFLISPDSVASDICEWEIDRAERLGKSILPVVVRETPAETIPGRLADINFIFYRSEDERPAGLQKLLKALTTDLAWEREKTRINDLAMVWANAGRPARLLTWREDAIRALERWRDGHPATSPAPTDVQLAYVSESRLRFTRRQRWIRGGLATGLTAMTALAAAAVFLGLLSEERRVEAETQRAVAENQRDQALTTQSLFLADLAQQEGRRGATGMLLALAGLPDQTTVTGAPLSDRPYALEAERALFAGLLVNRERLVLQGHSSIVTSVTFSPYGTRLATASDDNTARLWDAATGEEIAALQGHSGRVISVAFSPDGTRLATASAD
ncbi:MAG: TIR domain-containing protein, partial [Pseudomonadota bacterium]